MAFKPFFPKTKHFAYVPYDLMFRTQAKQKDIAGVMTCAAIYIILSSVIKAGRSQQYSSLYIINKFVTISTHAEFYNKDLPTDHWINVNTSGQLPSFLTVTWSFTKFWYFAETYYNLDHDNRILTHSDWNTFFMIIDPIVRWLQ